MRFRTDGWHYADLKTFGWTWDGDGEKSYGKSYRGSPDEAEAKKCFEETPKAEPGDTWRQFWSHHDENDKQIDDRLAGYAICCMGCGHVHAWTTASNCQFNLTEHHYTDKDGKDVAYKVCGHSGVGSCWVWTGSAEEGTLTARPSLQVTLDKYEPGGCNWHGYIDNGDLHT